MKKTISHLIETAQFLDNNAKTKKWNPGAVCIGFIAKSLEELPIIMDRIVKLEQQNGFLSSSLDAHATELDRQSHRARFYSDLTSGVLSYLSGMCNKLSPALRLKVWDYIDRLNLDESKFNEDYIGFKFTKPAPPTPLQFFAGIDTSKLYGGE